MQVNNMECLTGRMVKLLPGAAASTLVILSLFLIISCSGKKSLPVLTTRGVTDISNTTASSGGEIVNKRGSELKSRGICWSVSQNPTPAGNKTDEGLGKGSYFSTMRGLIPGTTYYLRAYAVKEQDTIYGNVISFSTQSYGMVTDTEGNKYKTLAIGTQVWMAENLRATKYNDGTAIPIINEAGRWAGLSSPACCWYKNSEAAFKSMYGAIYNWYAVNTGKLCPVGWHVPSDSDWDRLANFLGGWNAAGGKLKETGDIYWSTPNTGATNESRFTALPGGLRYLDGEFRDFGFGGYWWSSSELSAERAFFRHLFYQDVSLYRFDNEKRNGFYVRCVRD